MTENPLSAANASSIFERGKAILLSPNAEWPKIAGETQSSADLFIKYAVPLAAVGPVASFIGGQLFGFGMMGLSYRPGLIGSLTTAIVSFVLALVGLVVLTLIADFLAPKFGGEANRNSAFRLVAYSSTASWAAGIFGLIPGLSILGLLGLYSLYLYYLGSGPMMKVPEDKKVGFTVVSVLCAIVLALAVAAVTTTVTGIFGTNPASMMNDGRLSGSIAIPGMGTIDVSKMEQAGKRMERMANGQIKPTTPDQLMPLLPASIGSYARVSTESAALGGMGSQASGSYEAGGNRFDLKVIDTAALGGLAGMAAAMNIEQTKEDADGYERIHKVGGQMVTEKWSKSSQSGTYSVLVGDRFMIEADGKVASIDVLKAAVATIDQGTLTGLGE